MPAISTTLVAVSIATIRKAENAIAACEACDPTVDVPFCWVLDRVTERNGRMTDYVMSEPAKCPTCTAPVLEYTLVSWC